MNYPRYRLASTFKFYFLLLIGMLKGKFLHARSLKKLENRLSVMMGKNQILAVPQARIGLYVYLKNCISPGDEVIISSYTLIDMVNMIICAGGKPVFCDVEYGHFQMSSSDLRKKITPRTKAVVASHLYGIPSELEKIKSICQQHGFFLFEDCAQSFGATVGGKWTGTFGDASVFSFGALKNVNGLFGGILIVEDKEIYEKCRIDLKSYPLMGFYRLLSKSLFCLFYEFISHPWVYSKLQNFVIDMLDKRGHVDKDAAIKRTLPRGFACQMTSLQADLILSQLSDFQVWAHRSRKLVDSYEEKIDLSGEKVKKFTRVENSESTFLQYPVWVNDGNTKLKKFLRESEIDINVDFFRNVSTLECFRDYASPCPNTATLIDHLALIPSYPRMSDEYNQKIAKAVETFVQKDAAILSMSKAVNNP